MEKTLELELKNQCEQIQEDIMCILDGVDDEDRLVTLACQVVVNRFNIMLGNLRFLLDGEKQC